MAGPLLKCNRPVVLSFCIVMLATTFACYSEDPKTLFEQSYPGYTLLDYRKGNFTNSGKAEYVIFLESKDKDKQITVTLIDEAYVVVVGANGIEKSYAVKDLKGLYDYAHFLPYITDKRVNWGKWDGFCYVRDFNGNGLDEILFFKVTGMSFLPYIFEYRNGKMRVILDPPPTYSNIMMQFEAVEETKKYIKIWGWGNDEKNANDPNGKRDWYKYVWNERMDKYQIVDKGLQ